MNEPISLLLITRHTLSMYATEHFTWSLLGEIFNVFYLSDVEISAYF